MLSITLLLNQNYNEIIMFRLYDEGMKIGDDDYYETCLQININNYLHNKRKKDYNSFEDYLS